MEPITLGLILAQSLIGIIPGIVCNRADEVFCNGFKSFVNYLKQEDGKLVNHDLQKALRRSFLSALSDIASECKDKLNDPSFRESFGYTDRDRRNDLEWLARKIKQLNIELTKIETLEYVETPIESLNDIELLLTPEGSLVEDRVQIVKEKLVNEALKEGSILCYKQKIEHLQAGLFERMCAYFAFEIKNNQVVNNIFQGQLLVQINQNLVEQDLTIQDLADSLRNVARDVPPQVLEKLHNLEEAIEQGNYKLDKGFGDVLAAITSSSVSIEEIKVLLERLIRDGDRTLPLNIDWRSLCGQVLAKQQENQRLRRKVTERGFELNIYVPLGLLERRQQQRRTGDVAREDVYQLEEQVITKEYHYDAFLSEVVGGSSKGNKHIAIVGEPGAGKTTLLDKVASWINGNNKGLPICIPLGGLQGKTLEEYLLKNWLEEALNFVDAEVRRDKSAVQKSLEECFRASGVWLLLDGLDEMAVTSTGALATIQEQLSGWVAQARVVLTSRLNIWDARVNNPLANFETYRTLEFSEDQVNEFIQGWFAAESIELGMQLQAQLKESQYQRLQELVKNPLRLALLCQTWYYQQGDLPETKAGLYQRFVRDFYGEWKSEYHPITWNQQQELNQALGKLALAGIGSEARFRLKEGLAQEVMGEPLFQLACDRGWLNLVDRDADTDEAVYAFFHPTFQEYFAALATDDWDFFLPRSHKNRPATDNSGKYKPYRIFEPQWKQVILLWLGREDVAKEQKEAFIKALAEFEDGCGEWSAVDKVDKGFYEYSAYFLAAAGIVEFKNCSFTTRIVAQIVKWGFSFDLEKEYQEKFLETITDKVRIVLLEMDRPQAIATLVELIRTCKNEYTRRRAIESLGKIGTGNPEAIAALVKLICTSKDKYTREQAIESLEKIDPGNPEVIAALIELVRTSKSEYTLMEAAGSLGKIDPGNPEAIAALVELVRTSKSEYTLMKAAGSLGKIDPGNPEAIAALVELVRTSKSEYTCEQMAYSLGKIDPGNPEAVAALVELIGFTQDECILTQAIESLWEIGTGNLEEIAALVELIRTSKSEYNSEPAAERLGTIDPGNPEASAALVELIRISKDESTLKSAAYSLGTIDSGNPEAIATLVELIGTSKSEYTLMKTAESLGKIDPGNPEAIAALVELIHTSQDEYIRQDALEILGEIDPGNPEVIAALVELIRTSKNEYIHRRAAHSLGKIDPGNLEALAVLVELVRTCTDKDTCGYAAKNLEKVLKHRQMAGVVTALKDSLNNFERFTSKNCYEVIWHCAQTLPYLEFYQAWHSLQLTPHPEVAETTGVGFTAHSQSLNLAELPQLLRAAIDSDSELRGEVQLICIDGSKFIDRDNPATKIYNVMWQQGCPKSTDSKPTTMAQLQGYWDELSMECDRYLVIAFYENPTDTNQGFSDVFLNALSRFDGTICVVSQTTIPLQLQAFSPHQPNLIADVVGWIRGIKLENS